MSLASQFGYLPSFNGSSMTQLSDVSPTHPSSGQVLAWDATTGKWTPTNAAGGGDVNGPATSTDHGVARWDGTSGQLLRDSSVTLSDAAGLAGVTSLTLQGATTANVLSILPNAATAAHVLTLPATQGSAGTFLSNDGAGHLSWASPAGGGNVTGPGSSTSTAIARYNGTTGTVIQNSGVTIDGSNNIAGAGNTSVSALTLRGATSGTVALQAAATTAAQTLTLPAAAASAGQFLSNDGTGLLSWSSPAGGGNVTGPGSSTSTAIARYNGTTGTVIQNSGVTIDGSNNIAGAGGVSASGLTLRGATSGTVALQAGATTASQTLTLPTSAASAGQFLSNDGTGLLSWSSPAGGGNVTGPGSSTSTAIARYNGTTGTVIQNSGVTIDASNNIAGAGNASVSGLTLRGATSGTVALQAAATTAAQTLTLPSAAATAGQFLSNDGTGALSWSTPSGGGNVTGPAGATDSALARYNGSTGTVIKSSPVVLSDLGALSNVRQVGLLNTGGTLTLQSATGTSAHTLTLPAFQGSNGTYLGNDGAGNLSWSNPTASAGNVFGPASSTTSHIACYSDGTGKNLKDANSVVLSDSGGISGLSEMRLSGASSGNVGIQAFSSTTSYTMWLPPSQGAPGTVMQNNGSGTLSWQVAVSGPVSSSNLAIPRFNGTSGASIQNSGVFIDSSNNVTGALSYSATNNVSAPTIIASTAVSISNGAQINFGTSNSTVVMRATTSSAWTFTLPTASPGKSRCFLKTDASGNSYWTRSFIAGKVSIGDINNTNTTATLYTSDGATNDFTSVTKYGDSSLGTYSGNDIVITWAAQGATPITYTWAIHQTASTPNTVNNDIAPPICYSLSDGAIALGIEETSPSTEAIILGIVIFYD